MSEELAPGATFAQYRIEEIVGRGGMGVVHRALDVRLRRHVALKLIASVWAQDERYRSRFLREARSAAAIEHPHIVPLHEAGEHDRRLFLAMRYVDGGDLRSIVRAVGPLPAERVAVLVAQLASALDAAHARGMAHRDVKPANALLASGSEQGDHVYLTDFGVARPVAEHTALTAERGLIGSLAYMAPEVIEGAPGDPASDRYALACTAYELLSGQPPFAAPSDAAVMFGHLNGAPPPLASAALDEVLGWGLAKAPGDRPPSCAALADALLGALGPEPLSSPRAGASVTRSLPLDATPPLEPTLVRSGRAAARRRALAVVACLAAGIGVGLALAPGDASGPFRLRSDVADARLPGWSGAAVGAGELAGLHLTARDSVRTTVAGAPVAATVGRLRSQAGGTAARGALAGHGTRRLVRLGAVTATEVSGRLAPGRGYATVEIRATTRGLVAASCVAATHVTVLRACRALTAALRPLGAQGLRAGPDPALADRVAALLGDASGGPADRTALAAGGVRARRAAALRLAQARSRAAVIVRGLAHTPPQQAVTAAIARALQAEAAALRSVAAAVRPPAEQAAAAALAHAQTRRAAAVRRLAEG